METTDPENGNGSIYNSLLSIVIIIRILKEKYKTKPMLKRCKNDLLFVLILRKGAFLGKIVLESLIILTVVINQVVLPNPFEPSLLDPR